MYESVESVFFLLAVVKWLSLTSDQLSSIYAHSACLCGRLGRVIAGHRLKCFSAACLEVKKVNSTRNPDKLVTSQRLEWRLKTFSFLKEVKNTSSLDPECTRVERGQKRAAKGETCQDEVGLVGGEHEDRDVLLGQWGND